MTNPTFDYKVVPINKIGVELLPFSEMTPKQHTIAQGSNYLFAGGKMIKGLVIDGEIFKPSKRFWSSLYSRFKLNKAFFQFFDHSEVFERIAQKENNPMIRVCIERSPGGDSQLLAATGTTKPVIVYDDLREVLEQYRLEGDLKYSNGVITTTHTPRVGASDFKIGADKFSQKFVLHAPIDGYGQPNFYLSLLRWVCSNGMVGWANAFKTTLQLGSGGDDVKYTLRRALEGFTNDEGFAQMRDRFEVAQQSWASLREQQALYKMLIGLQNDPQLVQGAGFERTGGILSGFDKEEWSKGHGSAILKAFTNMTGDPYEVYQTDANAMSPKRQRSLPVECRMYDLLNFATEVATHHISEGSARELQAWVGEMISHDFDLEGSCDAFEDFRAFFVGDTKAKDVARQGQAGVNYE